MKLLVVDDDLHIRRLIAIYLRDAGFEVISSCRITADFVSVRS